MIHAYLPADDRFIAYSYRADLKNNKITINYNSNFPKKGTIEILCPGAGENTDWETRQKVKRVLIDGKQVSFRLMRKNNDVLIVFETDFLEHRAVIYF